MKLDQLARPTLSPLLAWLPYLLLAAILVASRTIDPFKSALLAVSFGVRDILGERGISGNFQPLYLPGGVLVAVCLITILLHRMRIRDFGHAVRESGGTLLGAGFVLVFTVPMVRIMIQSGVNANELASMPIAMAHWVAVSVGAVYPLFAPTVGALGVSGAIMVATQSVGAAAGNMIAIDNVVAASATVGLLGREGITLRRTSIPTIYYVLLAGTLTMLAIHVLKVTDPLLGVPLK